MRIAAGILMIIVSFTVFSSFYSLTELLGETTISSFAFLPLLLLGLIWGTAACAFMKKRWTWALAGAICSVLVAFTFAITSLLTFPVPLRSGASVVGASLLGIIFIMMGVVAVMFLTNRKGEFD